MAIRTLFAFTISLLLSLSAAFGQIFEPVKWEVSYSSTDVEGEYIIIFKAEIDENWKVYGNDIKDGGPIRTDILFEDIKGYRKIGGVEQLGRKEGPAYDPQFDMDLTWFKKKAVFRQTVKVTSGQATVKGFLEFMTCDDVKCLPPDEVPFEFVLKGSKASTQTTDPSTDTDTDTGEVTDTDTETDNGDDPDETVTENTEGDGPNTGGASSESGKSANLWGYLLLGIGGGLLALLTPCVFPMIPLTVSFFTKSSSTRRKGLMNAITYALSIILIFIGLGFIITLGFGPSALNAMASSNVFNVAFFVIFIIFAISFFGAFEITLPSRFVNNADAMSEKGGLIGIFFMAFTLVLVSFSCTMPIIGSLLVLIADSGAFWAPLMGLLGFSLALAIPFALFAAFPGWLNNLPKSGGWLNTVKVSLGFVELALAFKFLSVADLAYHWNFLTRDIFIAIWIIIAILLGVYLLGRLRFPGEPPVEHVGITRLFLAIASFAFAIYMVPGMWGAPVKMLSGLAPPQHYQEFSLHNIQFKLRQMESQLAELKEGDDESIKHSTELAGFLPPDVINIGHCPHELSCYFDLDRGLAEAKRTNKPLLLDFTGWSCVNCRKMEDHIWSQDKVWAAINSKYVLVSLYVDDKSSLPEEFQVSKYTGNRVRTVGKLWSDLQRKWYNSNSQPYYVVLDHDLNKVIDPIGYTPNADNYLQYLNAGVDAFNQRQLAETAGL